MNNKNKHGARPTSGNAGNHTKKCPQCNAEMGYLSVQTSGWCFGCFENGDTTIDDYEAVWEDMEYRCPECDEVIHVGDDFSATKFWESLQ